MGIYRLGNVPEQMRGFIGGKAGSLDLMIRNLNVRVPEGYVLTAGDSNVDELLPLLDQNVTYAVRSSAINEDGEKASFAGQYETITDVKVSDIKDALRKVIDSAGNGRVREYTQSFNEEDKGIAVVIQRFVKPEFAGVIFTSDAINGRDDQLVGNYVRGEGEQLVSGNADAKVFRIGVMKYAYNGDEELRKFSRILRRYCLKIRRYYKMPMDIEWAVSGGKVYILQARPITTLQRLRMDSYDINGSRSGLKLLTRTNVGEIFMKPVSPMTFSVLELINDMLGLPDWLDNICGQAYMNITVMCSALVSFGMSEKKAFESIKDLVGNIPDGYKVPISPFDKKVFLHKIRCLVFPKEKSKLSKKEKHDLVVNLADIARNYMDEIKAIDTNEGLAKMWDSKLQPGINDGLAAIAAESGAAMVPLFTFSKKLEKVAGEELAQSLLGGCLGVVESMRPLYLLDDVISGKITRDEYIRICGHRSADEMELMEPRPYEDPAILDKRIEEHKKSGVDLKAMKKAQTDSYEAALKKFKELYPSRSKWIEKNMSKYAHANEFREDIRSKGVYLFCVFREYLLRAGKINGIDEDIFMLTYKEAFALIRGNMDALRYIEARRKTFNEYRSYPPFPSLVLGRFDPQRWIASESRRNDFYFEDDMTEVSSDVKGFPGAAGSVTGVVRVITDISHIDELKKGEILVAPATNIGWTPAFSKVSAIVTDIGAPLSHAAIVAREFGIPAVVGCGNATTVLKTGDTVTVNGASGVVIKVSGQSS